MTVPKGARAVMPGSTLQLEEIQRRWNDSREELTRFVSWGNSEILCKGIFEHPVGGWMGMEQILNFFSVHLVHHRYRFNRIARSAGIEKT